jgi:SAM-dependent methyltransferase
MVEYFVGDLPLFLTFNVEPDVQLTGAPSFFPFSLTYEEDTTLVSMYPNADLVEILSAAYAFGSEPSGYMAESGIGKNYAEDFAQFIENNITDGISGKEVLEIGSGEGYLLKLLHDKGANCVGIDPNSQSVLESGSSSLCFIKGFFPRDLVDDSQRFDAIVMYAVLEHLENPGSTFFEISKRLKKDGKLILSVPNCEPYLNLGDPSLLFHEHYHYFTTESLRKVLVVNGFECEISFGGYGGTLYATATRSPVEGKIQFETNSRNDALEFLDNLNQIVAKFKLKLNDWKNENLNHIGIWVPNRIMNLLSLVDIPESITIRFFDDNALIQGLYLPGFQNKIESREDFFKHPTQVLIITSFSFGEEIRGSLGSLENIEVVLLEELLR